MAQPADEKEEVRNVWPTQLLLDQTYATTFSCIQCKNIPKLCMNDEDGKILCDQCARDVDNVAPTKAVQNMINNLKTRCLSLQDDIKNDEKEEGMNVIITQVKDNQCDWTGMIKEWDEHSKQCQFVLVQCDDCKTFQCQRKVLAVHKSKCPETKIDCPLSCGMTILRKNKTTHLRNVCVEQVLDCTNDDCKLQVKRKQFDKHVNEECDERIVDCDFSKYGCSVKQIKACDLKTHIEKYKFEHLQSKFDFMMQKFDDKVVKQNETISQLQKHGMPKGSIVMWSGNVDNIPNGWKLCDGQNGTPDLRNRFVIGASDDVKMNSTGGTDKHNHDIIIDGHQLTVDEMPKHAHQVQQMVWVINTGGGLRYINADKGSFPKEAKYTDETSRIISDTGNNQTHNHDARSSEQKHLPPYFALCFIVKDV